MIKVSENKQSGFTLIEIIITLVIAAVVGAGVVQYLGSAFTKSAIPIQRLRQAHELQQVMENITEDYLENVTDTTTLADLKDRIDLPTPAYGTYIVDDNDFIWFDVVGTNTYDESTTGTQTVLKVTIKNDLGDILTTLFSVTE